MADPTPADPSGVGQELLDVPFPEMVEKLALAIAAGQLAMDLNSVKVATLLATTDVPAGTVPVEIQETTDTNGNITQSQVVLNKNPMPLLVYGLNPTFYQFTDAQIKVQMTITMVSTTTSSQSLDQTFKIKDTNTFSLSAGGGILSSLIGGPKVSDKNTVTAAYASTYNAKYASKYQFNEQGTSLLQATLRPVPPPQRSVPTVKGAPPAGSPAG